MLWGQGFNELNTSVTISKRIAVASKAKALLSASLDEENCTMLIPSERRSGCKVALLTRSRSRTQLQSSNEAVADRKRENKTGKYCDTFPKGIREPYAVYEMP